MEQHKDWDCIIVGGGLVGLIAAHLLARQAVRVLVLEAKTTLPTDGRLLSLNLSTQAILAHMDRWTSILPHVTPIYKVEISIQGRFPRVPLADPQGHPLGYSVDFTQLQQVLSEDRPFPLHTGVRLVSMQPGNAGQGWCLKDENGKTYHTALLIGADGARSWVRQQLGMDYPIQPYHQIAIVAHVDFENPHHGKAYERFCAEGVLALIPMHTHRMGLIWMVPVAAMQPDFGDPDSLPTQIRAIFGDRLGKILAVTDCRQWPLQSAHVRTDTARCAVLLGQSAHQMHPVGAQSLNLAIEDAAALVTAITQARAAGRSIADPEMLASYAVARRPRHYQVAQVIDRLARYLIGGRMPAWIQALGLQLIAWVPPLQTKMRIFGRGQWAP